MRREESMDYRRRGMPGFTTPETHGKWSLRASANRRIGFFHDVKVPKENLLPGKAIGCTNDVPGLCPIRHCVGAIALPWTVMTPRDDMLLKEFNSESRLVHFN